MRAFGAVAAPENASFTFGRGSSSWSPSAAAAESSPAIRRRAQHRGRKRLPLRQPAYVWELIIGVALIASLLALLRAARGAQSPTGSPVIQKGGTRAR